MMLKSSVGCPALAHKSRKGVVVRAELLKKPELKRPEQPKLFGGDAAAAPTAPKTDAPGVVTIEYQRARAKEMRQYFIEQRTAEVTLKAKVFGWTPKNEIANGRWVMFGLLVGMLTEYATGVDFIDQLALMVSYLGILDLE
ncbi:hypothetical protein GPECTOR_55g335 [Gonium pectorale]|uniref:Uncharacterized protein n=1 Tax=Gonium pectorale TaxID=33097 RepID=A0A150G6C8_GONPE|nr:hypothetical protein GPECTOR_55g335 [Gonium pectorale]|eukprot:KXZ45429.1 hypothetical protein GPECTOR_55g335 [Gonium pectorale]